MLTINEEVQKCKKCGSTDLSLLDITDEDNEEVLEFACDNCMQGDIFVKVLVDDIEHIDLKVKRRY